MRPCSRSQRGWGGEVRQHSGLSPALSAHCHSSDEGHGGSRRLKLGPGEKSTQDKPPHRPVTQDRGAGRCRWDWAPGALGWREEHWAGRPADGGLPGQPREWLSFKAADARDPGGSGRGEGRKSGSRWQRHLTVIIPSGWRLEQPGMGRRRAAWEGHGVGRRQSRGSA